MSFYDKQIKNLKGVPVFLQVMKDGQPEEIPVTLRDVFLAVLNDYRPKNMAELSICVTATRKIQKDDENLDEDEVKKLVDLVANSNGLAMYTIMFTLDSLSEKFPAVKDYISKKFERKSKKDKKKASG